MFAVIKGQTHTHRYVRPLPGRVAKGEIDPSFVITRRYRQAGPAGGQRFLPEKDDRVTVVLKP